MGGDDSLLEKAFGDKEATKAEDKKVEPAPDDKAKEVPKADEKKVEDKKPDEKVEDKKPEEPEQINLKNPRDARQAIERRDKTISTLQSERDTAANELKKFQARVAELEGKGSGDAKVLTEQLAAEQKRAKELEGRLAEKDYAEDPTFKEKFVEPYRRTVMRAIKDVEELVTTDAEGKERKGTRADFEQLLALPLGAARRLARETFGEDAGTVLRHIERLNEIKEDSQAALDAHRQGYEGKRTAEQAEQTKQRELLATSWKLVNDDFAKKPEFAPGEDAEENASLQKGYEFVDVGYSNQAKMTMNQRLIFDATMRHRVALSHRLEHQVGKLKSQIEAVSKEKSELEQTVKELRDSAPGPGKKAGGGDLSKAEKGRMSDEDVEAIGRSAFEGA